MSTDVPIDVAARDLKGWLEKLPCGESLRLLDSGGEPVALVLSLKRPGRRELSFEEWEKEWDALAREVSKAWKGDKTALETLAEMRR